MVCRGDFIHVPVGRGGGGGDTRDVNNSALLVFVFSFAIRCVQRPLHEGNYHRNVSTRFSMVKYAKSSASTQGHTITNNYCSIAFTWNALWRGHSSAWPRPQRPSWSGRSRGLTDGHLPMRGRKSDHSLREEVRKLSEISAERSSVLSLGSLPFWSTSALVESGLFNA